MKAKDINKKYFNRYIEILKTFNYSTGEWDYEVIKSYKNIHENTTLGQDVGTSFEYRR